MKFWGYYCLGVFVLALAASLATFGLATQPTDVGDIGAAIVMVLCGIGLIAAVLSKVVGFGDQAIPKERRGLLKAVKSLPIAVSICLLVAIAYLIGISATSKITNVRKVLNAYYLDVPAKPGEQVQRQYTAQSGPPTHRINVPEDVALRQLWTRVRLFTAIEAAVAALCGGFFLSRAARQSPELKQRLEAGLLPSQVDDSMNL